MIEKKVLKRVLKKKYLTEPYYDDKEIDKIADLMIKDDFKKNNIKTWSGVLIYLDHVQSLRKERNEVKI